MNEQIRLLALQAGMIVGESNGFDKTKLTPRELKFAELIVKECCKQLWSEECHTSDLAYLEYTRNTDKIKRHFGVY